ncbi:MAG: glycosyltransferase family 4 protein [Actinomycetota bacterium]|nr:glycosyltransferase family 4 protein [Actinomycetota bacterium]
MTRFALLGEIAAPYRVPLYNALAERLDFLALFLADADPRRAYYRVDPEEIRFEWRVLGGRELGRGRRWTVLSRGVFRELERFDPDVVGVGGWNQPAFWQALAWTKLRRRKLVLWIESTARDARSEARPLELAKRAMVRAANGYFVPGTAAKEYALSLGVPEGRLVVAPNAVDASVYGAAAVDRSGRESCTFLYAGRLDPEKGLDTLLRAFRDVPGQLVIAGSGSDEERLRALADDRVRFSGPIGRAEIVRLLAEADVFVLPSRSEPWGMVLNEAAAAGLPLVATDGVGAAYDLIDDDGFRIPVDDERALAEAMRRLAEDPQLRARLGTRSRELVAGFTPEAWADALAGLVAR